MTEDTHEADAEFKAMTEAAGRKHHPLETPLPEMIDLGPIPENAAERLEKAALWRGTTKAVRSTSSGSDQARGRLSAGPSCLSDHEWATMRQTREVPQPRATQAHLASCRRCRPRAIVTLPPGVLEQQLRRTTFPADMLCLDEAALTAATAPGGELTDAARRHLAYCLSCGEDVAVLKAKAGEDEEPAPDAGTLGSFIMGAIAGFLRRPASRG